MSSLTVVSVIFYKDHAISRVESPMQVFYVVDDNFQGAFWSVADAKRSINGKPLVSQPVDITHI